MSRFLKKSSCFLLALFTCSLLMIREGRSQYYLIGTDPGSVKWSQIKTPNFKVFYPRTWEGKGQYIANGLEYIYRPGSISIYGSTPRTPVIIHLRNPAIFTHHLSLVPVSNQQIRQK